MRLLMLALALWGADARAACTTGGAPLNLQIPSFSDAGTVWATCLQNDFNKLSTATTVQNSTLTMVLPIIMVSTVSGYNASGVYVSSYTLFGASVALSGPLNLTSGQPVTGAATFTSSFTVNAAIGISSTTGKNNLSVDSNGIISSTSQPVMRWTNSGNVSIANVTDTEVTLDQKAYDSVAMFSVSAATVPAAGAGIYDIRCSLTYSINSIGIRLAYLKKNNVSIDSTRVYVPSTGGSQNTTVVSQARLLLAVGDAIKCFGYQDSGVSLNLSAGLSAFEIVKLW